MQEKQNNNQQQKGQVMPAITELTFECQTQYHDVNYIIKYDKNSRAGSPQIEFNGFTKEMFNTDVFNHTSILISFENIDWILNCLNEIKKRVQA